MGNKKQASTTSHVISLAIWSDKWKIECNTNTVIEINANLYMWVPNAYHLNKLEVV